MEGRINRAKMNSLQADMQLTVKKMELRRKGKLDKDMESTKENQQPADLKIDKGCKPATRTPSHIPRASKASSTGKKVRSKYRLPAGYTWNKGGRLKEIRIRTRARKFVDLWKMKTFGRVVPSKAELHFKKCVMKKAFSEWKVFWWEARIGWKLQVRAEYHHRYSLYSLIWLNWRRYTLESRENRVKIGIAETQWINKVQKSKLESWKLYIQLRRTKKSLYGDAKQVISHNRLKNAMRIWKLRFLLEQKAKHDKETALLHWMAVTQRSAWRIWSSLYKENIRQRTRALEAENHHNSIIVQKCFSAWLQRQNTLRKKQKLYDFAACVRNRALATHCLLIWRQRWRRNIDLRKKEHAVEKLSCVCVKRRAFLEWIHFINNQREKRRKLASAKVYHRRKMLKTSVCFWKELVIQQKRKAAMLDTALSFRWKSSLRRTWTKWQDKLDIAEDAKMTDLIKIAVQHHNTVLSNKMMRQWMDYVKWRRERAQKKVCAHMHFASRALPNCFRIWRNFVTSAKLKSSLKEKADDFCLSTLKMKYFYSWWEKFDQCRECRTLERIAFVHNRELTLRSNFTLWKQKASRKIVERRYATHADLCYRDILLKRAFRQFKELLTLGKAKRLKIIRAATYCYHNTLAGSWLAWRSYVQNRRTKRRLNLTAVNFYERNSLAKCIMRWREKHSVTQNLKALAVAKCKEKETSKMRKIFKMWQCATSRRLCFKSKLKKAEDFNSSKILVKWLTHWQEWTAIHCHKRMQKQQKLNEVTDVLQRRKAWRILIKWKEATVESKAEKHNTMIATEHFGLKICKITFQMWKVYRYVRLKKSLMVQQACHFRSQKLIEMCFSLWKIHLADKDIENKMEDDALWHWALKLQQKVLVAWVQYTQERKRKHERYDNALQQRRLYLLRKGCTQILEYHSEIIHFKTKAGAAARAHSSYTAYHLAWKFARKWRDVVHKRKEVRRKDLLPIPKPTNLTFIVDKPMYYPIADAVPIARKDSQLETVTNWLPEPRQAPLQPFTIPTVPLSPERSLMKMRPAPRGPDFLMDSLQRDGLDEHVDFDGKHVCPLLKPASSAPVLTNIEQEANVSSHAFKINQADSYQYGEPESYIQTLHCEQQEDPASKVSLGIQTTPNRSPDFLSLSPQLRNRTVRFNDNYQADNANFLLMPPSAFISSQSGFHPNMPSKNVLAAEEDCLKNSFSSMNESFCTDTSQISSTNKSRVSPHKGQSFNKKDRKMAKKHQAEDTDSSLDHHTSDSESSLSPAKDFMAMNTGAQPPRGRRSVAAEIDQIKRDVQDYQEKKETMKVLKRQKEFLENWLVQQRSRSICNSSIFGPAQDEIQQLNNDLKVLAVEIQAKRPQIEKLIERVKFLSKQPTER